MSVVHSFLNHGNLRESEFVYVIIHSNQTDTLFEPKNKKQN